MQRVRGFTLIELITVIVLLSIISVVALPKFFSKSAFDERFFYDDTLSAIRYAQQLAVAKGCFTRFSLSSTGYTLNYDSQCGAGSVSLTGTVNRPGTSDPYQNADVPAGTSNITIVFDPAGQAGSITSGSFSAYSSTQSFTIGSRSLQIEGPTGFSR